MTSGRDPISRGGKGATRRVCGRHRQVPCLAALLWFLGACASSGKQTAPAAADGVYDFVTRVGAHGELRGKLVVFDGEVALQPDQGACRVDQASVSFERVRYLCDNTFDVDNFSVSIDRRNPTTRSSWSGSVRQTRTRSVCAQYGTQNGRQVCVRTQTETYEVTSGVGGPLHFVKRSGS